MSLAGLERLLERSESFARALNYADCAAEFAIGESLRPALLAALLHRKRESGGFGPLLLITATSREAE